MPAKLERCVEKLKAEGKTEEEAYAICSASISDSDAMVRQFADSVELNLSEKTALTVRDGVLEYLGTELGIEPADKVFTVYRSPATIANAAYKMPGIPITDEHVDIDGPPPNTGSRVESSEVVDHLDESTHTRLAVANRLLLTDSAIVMAQEKRQMSLGYSGRLIPHQRWDFEQVDLQPHHLAAVPAGRCGPLCSFLDRKLQPPEGENMKFHKAFLDADGTVNLEQTVQIAASLPEALKSVPLDKLQEIMPQLQEIVAMSKQAAPATEESTEEAMTDEDAPKEEMTDEDMTEEEEKPVGFSDADVRKFVDAEVAKFASVVEKARHFLDSSYTYAGKTAVQVMRDALATQTTETFTDSELSVAFKLMRKSGTDYSQFGDAKGTENALEARIKQELGEE